MSNKPNEEVAGQHAIIGNVDVKPEENFKRTEHPDAQWFPEAGLGLFIHWGISSVLGQYDLSWGMMKQAKGSARRGTEIHGLPAVRANVSPRKYWEQAKYFKADKYDPDKWIAAAKAAGMEYCVLTTRHHDGFALWPSEYGDFGTKNYLDGRDLLMGYVEACRKNDIKVGFYYSPPDWYWNRERMSFSYGDTPPLGIDHESISLPEYTPEEQARLDDEYNDYVRGQVTELLTRYGKIDIIWFDGRLPRTDKTISVEEIRQYQPGILINPRGHGYGDFRTPECKFPQETFSPEWWELCFVFSDGAWGYLNHECYKPNGWLLAELSKTRAWNGNFLPNVGADGHGQMPQTFYLRMAELAEWMQHSGESVKGTKGGIWPERCNVPVTRNDSAWYVHIDWVCDDEVTVRDVDEPEQLIYLRTGEEIPYKYNNRNIVFTFPENSKTILTDVVKVIW